MNLKQLIYCFLLQGLLLSCSAPAPSNSSARIWSSDDREFLATHLQTSLDAILSAVDTITEEQWNWQPDSNTWSIALVLEHLITHEELFYREVRVLSNLPSLPNVDNTAFASDEAIMSYQDITDQNRGKAPSYLAPRGRWCEKGIALESYQVSRRAMIEFVNTTTVNLRAYYTKSGRGPTAYRDLHQLLLISVAHTRRHDKQIRSLLSHPAFPAGTSN